MDKITIICEVVESDRIQGTESLSWIVCNATDIYDQDTEHDVKCFDYEDAYELATEYQRKYKTVDIVEVG